MIWKSLTKHESGVHKPERMQHGISMKRLDITTECPMLLLVLSEVSMTIWRNILHNLGLGLALNVGLKECRNELVARMDTDDCSKPDRCEKQLARFAEKPYLAIVGSHIDEFVGDTSNVISQRIVPTTSEEIYNFAKKRSAFNHPAVMYSKTAVLAWFIAPL